MRSLLSLVVAMLVGVACTAAWTSAAVNTDLVAVAADEAAQLVGGACVDSAFINCPDYGCGEEYNAPSPQSGGAFQLTAPFVHPCGGSVGCRDVFSGAVECDY